MFFSVLIALIIFAIIIINYFPNLTSKYFELTQVTINGSIKSNTISIKDKIYDTNSNLFSLDLYEVKELIEQEQWIKRVNVKKVYPSTLVLDIIENDPYAIFRNKGKYYLLDIDGTIISKTNKDHKLENFLIISGTEAPIALEDIIKKLNINFFELLSQLKELEFVERRRWNLRLKNNLLIKLPDSKIDDAIVNLKNLFIEEKVLQSNIIEIDLRIEGRASLKVDEGKINFGIDEI
tara:strand:- start:1175 stop:1882 length:708 start_codon:yes stop_codon:yes gene_type:complete